MAKDKDMIKDNKTEVEKTKFIPGEETDEQFEKVLSLLSQWMKAGIVEVSVDVDGDISFELPKEMDKLLETQVPKDLTHKKVIKIINAEIPVLISAGLLKNPERTLRMEMPETLHEKMDTMIERSKKAVETLIEGALKERIMLRKTTAAYVLDDIESIQSTYHIEVNKEEKLDIPFISLELALAKPRSGYLLMLSPRERALLPVRQDTLKITIDLHRDDIKDLIQKLNKIEDKISN